MNGRAAALEAEIDKLKEWRKERPISCDAEMVAWVAEGERLSELEARLQGELRVSYLTLFLKFRLLPEPEALAEIRARWAEEISELEQRSSRVAGRTVVQLEAHKARRIAEYWNEIEAARVDLSNYTNWYPTLADWVNLATAQAIANRDPGFEYIPERSNKGAEVNWSRDNLINGFLQQGRTAKAAAVAAANHIAAQVRAGSHHYGKDISAAALEADFSTRRAAMRAGKDNPTRASKASKQPAIISNCLRLRSHISKLLSAAMKMSG